MAVFEGRLAGSFGQRGGIISTDVFGDENLQFGLMRLAEYVDDAGPPLRASKAIAKADMRERFVTDTAPNGDSWTPLDPDYVQKKSKSPGLRTHPEDILTLTRRLENAATSESSWHITPAGDSLFFETSGLPDYWSVHQYGTDEGGTAGMAADFRERVRSGSMAEGGGGARDSYGIGRGKATPARPFIGLSEEAELQILEVFDIWYSEGVRVNISRAGIVQERMASGRFGPRLFPAF